MNARIKQLAEQANIEFTYDPTETPMRAFVECWEDELEKFAELIVLKCAELMYGRDEDGNCKDGDVIKQHFGVEE